MIDGIVLKWIESCLTNRRQRIVKGEIISSWVDISSGVPQGTVIRLFLFVIYINELPNIMKNITKLYEASAYLMNKRVTPDFEKIFS